MDTLEMAQKLRKNPKLKAECRVGDVVWKVKCVNGSIMWDDPYRPPEFVDMSNCILDYHNWVLIEENKMCEIYYMGEALLTNGIGELPKDKTPIDDIFIITLDGVTYKTRAIDRKFAVPINDKKVQIIFKYNKECQCIYVC